MTRLGARGRGLGTAQDVTYRWLKRHIAQLPRSGGTFVTEAEVAPAAGTSRTPAREALLRLEAEGFLEIVPKKGAFVPPISDAEVRAVMQARELVEDWSVRTVLASEVEGEFVAELDDVLAEQERLLDDPVRFIDHDRLFHRAIVRRAGNGVLAEFYESLRERQLRMGLRAVASSANRARTVLAEHAAIVAALRERDTARAVESVRAHLASTLAALHLPDVIDPDGAIGPRRWSS